MAPALEAGDGGCKEVCVPRFKPSMPQAHTVPGFRLGPDLPSTLTRRTSGSAASAAEPLEWSLAKYVIRFHVAALKKFVRRETGHTHKHTIRTTPQTTYAPSPRHLRSLLGEGGWWFFVWSFVVLFWSCVVSCVVWCCSYRVFVCVTCLFERSLLTCRTSGSAAASAADPLG